MEFIRKMNGIHKEYDENGGVRFEETYINDKKVTCGIVRIYHKEDCEWYECECGRKEKECDGFCKCKCNEKVGVNLKEEYFQNNGIKEGIYKSYYYNKKTCVECNYINGSINGVYKSY